MAEETTTIQGKILGATAGRLEAVLSGVGSTPDGADTHLVNMEVQGVIDASGSIVHADGASAFTLVPNDVITPAGTYWTITFWISEPVRYKMKIYVELATAPDPLDIGDYQEPDSLAVADDRSSKFTPVTSLPTAAVAYVGKARRLTTDDGTHSPGLWYCEEDPDNAGTYDWVQIGSW